MTRHRKPKSITALAVAAALAVAGFVGFQQHQDEASPPAQAQHASPQKALPDQDAAHVLDQLQQLPIADENGDGYRRAAFGKGWKDLDGNGCSTRDEILARDLENTESSNGCVITSGTLNDPYTGASIDFTRGEKSSQAVQIDHQVPLSQAWASGARDWDKERRVEFANDPENLLAVDGSANQSKQDKDAAEWLPDNPNEQCGYVARQVYIKDKYQLSIDQREHDALSDVLQSC